METTLAPGLNLDWEFWYTVDDKGIVVNMDYTDLSNSSEILFAPCPKGSKIEKTENIINVEILFCKLSTPIRINTRDNFKEILGTYFIAEHERKLITVEVRCDGDIYIGTGDSAETNGGIFCIKQ